MAPPAATAATRLISRPTAIRRIRFEADPPNTDRPGDASE